MKRSSTTIIIKSKNKRLPMWLQRVMGSLTLTNIFIFFVFIACVVIAQSVATNQFKRLKAANGTAKVSILPASTTLTSSVSTQVWVTSDKPVAFSHVTVKFDQTKLALDAEPSFSSTVLNQIVMKTTVLDANATGVFTFALGIDPAQRTNPPSGTFQLATLKFKSKTAAANVATSVSVDSTAIDVVDISAVKFSVTTQASTITINPLAATATVIPTARPDVPIGSFKREGVDVGTVQTAKAESVRSANMIPSSQNTLYMVSVSTKPNIEVKSIEGLGLSWARAGAQCGGRSQTRTEIWWAYGSPEKNDYVTALFTDPRGLKTAVLSVVRYTGSASTPVVAMVSRNSNGSSDTSCRRGSDKKSYSLNLTNTFPSSLLFGAVSTRGYSHTTLNGFTSVTNVRTSVGRGDDAGIAVMEKNMTQIGIQTLQGEFSQSTDYAAVLVELRAK